MRNAEVRGAGRTCQNLSSLARYNMRKQEVLNLNVGKSWYFCTHSAQARARLVLGRPLAVSGYVSMMINDDCFGVEKC